MTIDQDKCVGCGQCMDVCTQEAVQVQTTTGYGAFYIDEGICIDCGECAEICPGEAIE
jgi:NAD-dependent dihydropyrimidine dehydrogenase PreA subunit